ncbi:MAG: repeat protein [Gemmataceae bacterium]|nr:repeat protein [Gemmataceae bacterium]
MAESTSRARLELTPLDDRTVPSTVSVSSTVRPLDFVGTGTLTTSEQLTDGGAAVTRTSTTTVALKGQINYTDNASGQTGTVTVTGTGTGTEVPTPPNTTGGIGSFVETTQAQLSFQDSNGIVSTPTPLTGTSNWYTATGASGTEPLGPKTATGSFDTSTFKLQAGWGAPGSDLGTLTATLAAKTPQPTALAFGQTAAALAADGSVTLDFSVQATGDLLKATSHGTAVTSVTATWQGGGQTQATDLNVPIYWNTGQLTVHAAGLTPPAWAKSLTVQIDSQHVVTQSSGQGNTWSITLAGLTPVGPPTGTSPPPTGTPDSPPTVPPPSPPTVPPAPPPVVASFALIPGPQPVIQWLSAGGTVLAVTPAFTDFHGPVSIATADVNHDSVPDLIIAAGVGGGPRVRVVDGKTGGEIANFFAYEPTFRGGVNIAVADLYGNGATEIVTGAGVGGGPAVGVFNAQTGQMINQFFAYDPSFTGGVSVAAANLSAIGGAEIITGAGAGGGPVIKVFDRTGDVLFSTFAAPPTARSGVRVAAAVDTADNAVVVTADPGPDAPLARFRNQLSAGGPLLIQLSGDPVTVT